MKVFHLVLRSQTLFFSLLLGAVCAVIQPSAWAIDIQSPRSASMGNSGRAGPLLNDAVFLNPAYTSFSPAYGVAFNWTQFNGAGGVGRNYTVSLQDGRNEFFQAGVAFSQMENGRWVHLGASKAIIDRASVGLSGKLFFPADGSEFIRQGTFSAVGLPLDGVQVALVIDNLFEYPNSVNYGLYREFVLGIRWNLLGIVSFYYDPQMIPTLASGTPFGFSTGGEINLGGGLFFRAGVFSNTFVPYNRLLGRGMGLGLGWMGPKLSLDFGFQHVYDFLNGTADIYSQNFGMTIFF